VKFDRRLGRNLREQVGGELGQGREDQEWRGQEQADEGQRELEQVREIASLRYGPDQDERVGERGLDDSPGRAANGVVALVEGRSGAFSEVRDYEPEVDRAERDSPDRQDRAGDPLSPRERVPDPEPRDDER
jgi:hypothetical protein